MFLVAHALRNQKHTRKLKLTGNIEFITRFFLLIRILCFCFLHLNLTFTVLFFFRRWRAWRSSGFTSWPVRDIALQKLLSKTSPIQAGTEFTSRDSWGWYLSLLTAFLSKSAILSLNNHLQFLLTVRIWRKIFILS